MNKFDLLIKSVPKNDPQNHIILPYSGPVSNSFQDGFYTCFRLIGLLRIDISFVQSNYIFNHITVVGTRIGNKSYYTEVKHQEEKRLTCM